MVRSSFRPPEPCGEDAAASLGALFSLALATSVDAFVVGAGFALVDKPVLPLALLAGGVTALACVAGIHFGRLVGCRFGKRVELLDGTLLILIGLNILITHLLDHGGLEWLRETATKNPPAVRQGQPMIERCHQPCGPSPHRPSPKRHEKLKQPAGNPHPKGNPSEPVKNAGPHANGYRESIHG